MKHFLICTREKNKGNRPNKEKLKRKEKKKNRKLKKKEKKGKQRKRKKKIKEKKTPLVPRHFYTTSVIQINSKLFPLLCFIRRFLAETIELFVITEGELPSQGELN